MYFCRFSISINYTPGYSPGFFVQKCATVQKNVHPMSNLTSSILEGTVVMLVILSIALPMAILLVKLKLVGLSPSPVVSNRTYGKVAQSVKKESAKEKEIDLQEICELLNTSTENNSEQDTVREYLANIIPKDAGIRVSLLPTNLESKDPKKDLAILVYRCDGKNYFRKGTLVKTYQKIWQPDKQPAY